MTALAPITPKLQKLLPLLSSDQPGEVVATAAAIGRALAGAGATWHDLAAALTAPPPRREERNIDIMAMLDALRRPHAILNQWERKFVADLSARVQRGKRLTPKQTAALKKIFEERIGGAA